MLATPSFSLPAAHLPTHRPTHPRCCFFWVWHSFPLRGWRERLGRRRMSHPLPRRRRHSPLPSNSSFLSWRKRLSLEFPREFGASIPPFVLCHWEGEAMILAPNPFTVFLFSLFLSFLARCTPRVARWGWNSHFSLLVLVTTVPIWVNKSAFMASTFYQSCYFKVCDCSTWTFGSSFTDGPGSAWQLCLVLRTLWKKEGGKRCVMRAHKGRCFFLPPLSYSGSGCDLEQGDGYSKYLSDLRVSKNLQYIGT